LHECLHESTTEPINQPTNQPIDQPVSQSLNQSINQTINQPINQPTNQSFRQPRIRRRSVPVLPVLAKLHRISIGNGASTRRNSRLGHVSTSHHICWHVPRQHFCRLLPCSKSVHRMLPWPILQAPAASAYNSPAKFGTSCAVLRGQRGAA